VTEQLTDDARRRRAEDTVDRALDLLPAKDMAGFAALWAPDGTLEFPFAPPGYPARLDGRDAVRDYLAGYPDLVDVREIASRTRHATTDPDTVVVEFEAAGFSVATGAPYRLRYIAVITVTDAGIASYRDYWSPLDAARALGGDLDDLLAAFAGSAR
jgi:uncharacterized protein